MADPTTPPTGAADAAPAGDGANETVDPGFGQGVGGLDERSDQEPAPEAEAISVEGLVADLERVADAIRSEGDRKPDFGVRHARE